MTEEVIEERQSKGWIAGGVVVVLLLIAAAFVAGRLLAPAEQGQNGLQLPPGMAFEGADPEGEGFQINISDVTPAPGIPATIPDARGLYVRRNDDTIVIGTGNVMAFVSAESDGVPEFNYDGIEVEVLVTNQTKLYEDVSNFTPGQTTFQQRVETLDNLDSLGSGTNLQVWGRHEGDRIIAETIVVMEPPPLPQRP